MALAVLCVGLRLDSAVAASADAMTPPAPNAAQKKAIDDYVREVLKRGNEGSGPHELELVAGDCLVLVAQCPHNLDPVPFAARRLRELFPDYLFVRREFSWVPAVSYDVSIPGPFYNVLALRKNGEKVMAFGDAAYQTEFASFLRAEGVKISSEAMVARVAAAYREIYDPYADGHAGDETRLGQSSHREATDDWLLDYRSSPFGADAIIVQYYRLTTDAAGAVVDGRRIEERIWKKLKDGED